MYFFMVLCEINIDNFFRKIVQGEEGAYPLIFKHKM